MIPKALKKRSHKITCARSQSELGPQTRIFGSPLGSSFTIPEILISPQTQNPVKFRIDLHKIPKLSIIAPAELLEPS